MANHNVVCKDGTPVACFERRIHASADVSGRLQQDQKAYDEAQVFIAEAEALKDPDSGEVVFTEEFSKKHGIEDVETLEERVALANALLPADEADYTITEV